jgi:transcriptional regulator with XRE-family HTH domain
MPANTELTSVLDRQLLLQLGERLKRARLHKGVSATEMARQAGISRMTLSAVEAGEPTPTIGTYLRVMGVLGVSRDLALVASEAFQPPSAQVAAEPRPNLVRVSAGDARHQLQDLQSLMLHDEAVKMLQKNPELIQQALDTLEKWRASGDAHSRFLWDEWSVILHRRAWRRALSHTRRSRELRQASPLATLLPPEVRQRVLDQVRELKAGVTLGEVAPPESRRRAPRTPG